MSSGDKGVQGLQYLNYFSYSLKFLLLNVSLFYLKQDKRAFTTQIFPALVFSNEGGFYMSKYRCEFPDWENEPRPCENPNEDPPVSCDSCFFGCEVDDIDL